ncbi:MAG: sulfite exporter TauE/SafE family protein, partial [Deltaproteobacteria bacterium]
SMSPTESVYPLLFVSGLLGGFGHCAGMCGPIVGAFSLCLGERRQFPPHLLYHLGRVTTYGVIGGAAGLAGSFLGIEAGLGRFQKGVAIGAGMLVILAGLALGGWLPRLHPSSGGYVATGLSARIARLARESGGPGVFYPLGLILGFLPCGLVYAALLTAARAGMEAEGPASGFLRGFLAMALFGAGTIPSLLLVGKAIGFLGLRMRKHLYRASAAMVVFAGAVFLVRALTG